MQNYWIECFQLFKKRLNVYDQNLDLLTIKQRDFNTEGREFVIQEFRISRLIEEYCKMCD